MQQAEKLKGKTDSRKFIITSEFEAKKELMSHYSDVIEDQEKKVGQTLLSHLSESAENGLKCSIPIGYIKLQSSGQAVLDKLRQIFKTRLETQKPTILLPKELILNEKDAALWPG